MFTSGDEEVWAFQYLIQTFAHLRLYRIVCVQLF